MAIEACVFRAAAEYLDREAFEKDLQWADALPMLDRLATAARRTETDWGMGTALRLPKPPGPDNGRIAKKLG